MERAREALAAFAQVGDRKNVVYLLAVLAGAAAQAGHQARAGRFWGAIEAEESRGPIGRWEQDREEAWRPVLEAAGPAFDAARAEGRMLALDEAITFATSGSRGPGLYRN